MGETLSASPSREGIQTDDWREPQLHVSKPPLALVQSFSLQTARQGGSHIAHTPNGLLQTLREHNQPAVKNRIYGIPESLFTDVFRSFSEPSESSTLDS